MFQWIPYAFIRIVVFFMAGILCSIFWPGISSSLAAAIFLALVGVYFLLVIAGKYSKRIIVNPGVVGLAAIFVAGYSNVQLKTESTSADHIINLSQKISYYKAVVTRYAEEKDKSWKLEAEVQEVQSDSVWKQYRGKVVLYLSKQDYKSPFGYGDVLLVKGS